MAPYAFTQAILEGREINLYDNGRARRDFTFVDDVIRCVRALVPKPPPPEGCPYRVYNVGSGQPVEIARLVELLEQRLGKKALTRLLPALPTEMPVTAADTSALESAIGYRPSTPLEDGLDKFVRWYQKQFPE